MASSSSRRLALPAGAPLWGRLKLYERHPRLKHNPVYGTMYLNCWYKVFFSANGLIVSSAPKWMPDYPVARLVPWDAVFERTSLAHLEDVVMALQRLVPMKAAGRPQAHVLDPAFFKLYPVLGEHMCATTWADGKPRTTSSLTVFTDGPLWKTFLNERNAALSLCVTAATYDELLAVLEASLEGDSADWRARKEKEEKNGKKK
jgi:hypothetical protein